MMILDLLKLSVRSFRVRRMRTFLTILGMSIGIGTVFFLISLGYGLQNILIGKLAPTADSLVSLEAYYPDSGALAITPQVIQEIKQIPNVVEVSPVAEPTADITSGSVSGSVMAKVVDPGYFRLSGIRSDIGTNELGENGAVVSNTMLKLLGWAEDETSLKKSFSLQVFPSDLNSSSTDIIKSKKPLTIVGIIKDESQPYVYIPSGILENSVNSFSRVFVKTSDSRQIESVRNALAGKGFVISARIDTVTQATRITTIITIVLGVFGITALVVSSIGMFNTMLISFMERIFEVGIMKSLGATQGDIRNLFLMESLVMGLLGGVGGILLGFVGGFLFNSLLNLLANYLGGKSVHLFIYPTYFMILIMILSGVVGILSGFLPARRAMNLSAREAFLRK